MSKIPKPKKLEKFRTDVFEKPDLLSTLKDIELLYLKSYVHELIDKVAETYLNKVYYPALNEALLSSSFSPLSVPNITPSWKIEFVPYDKQQFHGRIPYAESTDGSDYIRDRFIERDAYCGANRQVIELIKYEQQMREKRKTKEIESYQEQKEKLKDTKKNLSHREIALLHYYLSASDEGVGITNDNQKEIALRYDVGSSRSLYNKYWAYLNSSDERCVRSGTTGDSAKLKRLKNVILNLTNFPNAKKRAEEELLTLETSIKRGKREKF